MFYNLAGDMIGFCETSIVYYISLYGELSL